MNSELVKHCKQEIDDLLQKGIIRLVQSQWSFTAFYINKNVGLERGIP